MSRDVPHPGALGIARRYLAAGFSVVPILADGSKRPALSSWKPYQKRPPTEQELRAWWGSGGNGGAPLRGFALIHGAVSGHSEVLDFDAPDAWDEFLSRAEAEGWSDLVAALLTVATPSGGRHLYYRCLEGSGVAGNQKLARAADGTVRIETRGEGGYTLAPGSPALCHPDHRPYRILSGRFDAVPVVTAEERAALLELARAGDRLVANPATASTTFLLSPRPSLLSPRLAEARHPSLASERGGSTPAVKRCPSGLSDKPSPPLSLAREGWRASARRGESSYRGDSIADHYNSHATVADVLALLMRHGWREIGRRRSGGGTGRAEVIDLLRPGKTGPGLSGTIGYVGSDKAPLCPEESGAGSGGASNVFYCFTTSAPPFEAEHGYSPFRVYALLECGGDFHEAARRLAAQGYGGRLRHGGTGGDGGGSVPPASQGEGDPALFDGLPFNLTDVGNAERLAACYGGHRIRHCPALGWLVYDGRRWARDESGEVTRLMISVLRRLHAEGVALERSGETDRAELGKAIQSWALRSEMNGRIKASIELAAAQPAVHVRTEALDADPWLLNVANGTLDLRTGTLRPHDPTDLLTRLSEVVYDPDAAAPLWERCLQDWHEDPEVRAYLARAAGYTLTGVCGEEVLFYFYGPGRNGKSKYVEALEFLLGDYATRLSIEVLMDARRSGAATPDLFRLRGARLAVASEIMEGKRINEALIKDLTGGDRITARPLYGEPFEFRVIAKMHVYGNHKPQIRGTDEGIWARLHKTDWERIIPPEQRDPDLSEKLRAEAPGILAWAVRGCLEWQKSRLAPPAAVVASSAEYRAEMDPFAGFFEAATVSHPRAWVQNADLREAYRRWSGEDDDRRLPSPNQFAERLRQCGAVQKVRKIDGASVRGWEGIGLKADVAEEGAAGRSPGIEIPVSMALRAERPADAGERPVSNPSAGRPTDAAGYSGYSGYTPVENSLMRAGARAHETLSPSAVTAVTAVTPVTEEEKDGEEDSLDPAEADARIAALGPSADPFADEDDPPPPCHWSRERGPVGEMLWYITVAGVTGGGATQSDAVRDLLQTVGDPVTDPAAAPHARRAAARERARLAAEGEPTDPASWLARHQSQNKENTTP